MRKTHEYINPSGVTYQCNLAQQDALQLVASEATSRAYPNHTLEEVYLHGEDVAKTVGAIVNREIDFYTRWLQETQSAT